jgi:hypothetical protein
MCRYRLEIAALLLLLILTSCNEAPKASREEKAGGRAEPVTAKTAFWEMYKSSHSWAADRVPLAVASKTVTGVKNEAGKAGMWTATFASPGRHEARIYTYSVVSAAPDIYKGVTQSHPIRWGGATQDALPFETSQFAIDSDKAYDTAAAQAAAWMKKHPDKEVSFTLGNAARFSGPVWYVLWGEQKSGYSVLVNASTGAIIKQK